ncbi:unnamed protein product, partial [Discosporangium mesarthrocarpum]
TRGRPPLSAGAPAPGFTGTRKGYNLVKEYEVPEQAPPPPPGEEEEEEGYPMLIYHFLHRQYPEEFPTQSSSRKLVRRKEVLLNGKEVRNDAKASRWYHCVSPGDVLQLQKRSQPGLFPQGKPTVDLEVLWEDDYMA